jgi:GPI mannosyltransferase 3
VTQHPIFPIVPRRILARLAWTSVATTLSLSLISHKEVRFLYPILPFLHVLSAQPLSSFFFASPSTSSTQKAGPGAHLTPSALRRSILVLILAVNLLIAGYASQVHQRGVIDVLSYLRHKHESRISSGGNSKAATTSVGFLMPCHSTPWRSHLVHPGISTWALTCEPPLDMPLSERAAYLDEADQFFIDPGPANWLKQHMEHVVMISSKGSRSSQHWGNLEPAKRSVGRRAWPHNLVFFEQLEPVLKEFLKGTRYKECWRGFNSHFHDDWRRVGDVIVWCMD